MGDLRYSVTYLLHRFTRCSEFPSWEDVDAADLAVWRKAVRTLHSRRYKHEGCEAVVTADWHPALSHLEARAEVNKIFHGKISRKEPLGDDFFSEILASEDKNKVEIQVEIAGVNKFTEYAWYPEFFAEKYIYDFFCIMNLSNPGSCDFLNVRHKSGEKSPDNRLLLSSYNFEAALYEALEERSPYAKRIDFERVLSWYDGLGLGVKQIAESPIEKAIFSTLHFCKLDGDLTSVVWIFHALESIYGTRVGESFSNLVNRISLLLNLEDIEKNQMKKNLRILYDHRSPIVHGGYKVHYPMSWSSVDPRIDEDMAKNFQLLQFGFNLILASIQTLILNAWYGVTVVEELVGLESPNK